MPDSKWPEGVFMRKGTTAAATIEVWREVFARLGIPKTVCSDNGPPFTSREVATFFSNNGVKQVFSAPYHPASNGEAERFVRSFKQGMKKMQGKESRQHCLQEFLLTYRTTPHCTTGKTPSEMMCGRRLRTKLDLIRPSTAEAVLRKVPGVFQPRQVSVGDRVLVQDYRGSRPTWIQGVVIARLSPVTYTVQVTLESGYFRWKRHIDQIRESQVMEEVESIPYEEPRIEVPGSGQAFDFVGREVEEQPYNRQVVEPGVRAPESPRPCVASTAAVPDEVTPRRSSRERRLPKHLEDYDLT